MVCRECEKNTGVNMNSKFLTWATGKIKLSSTELGTEALETSGNQEAGFGHVVR